MTWLIVIIVVAVICGFIGWVLSGGEGEGCLTGLISGGVGCAGLILKIFLIMVAIGIFFKLCAWLFS